MAAPVVAPVAARSREPRRDWSWLKWALALCVGAAMAAGSQWQLARVPARELDVNLLFVPPEGLTRGMATGYQNVIADGLWLGLLQYYGDRVAQDDRHAVNLPAMFDLITNLDARFYFAYWLGAWALEDNHEAAAAVSLLDKGERQNPGDYQYPYLQGFIRFLGNRDYMGAAACFERASKLPGAPRFARTMAARMYETEGHEALSLQIWQGIAEHATDATTRGIARRNVERIRDELAGKRPHAFKRHPGPHDPA